MVRGDALPSGLRRIAGLPNQAAALVQSFKGVGVRKGLGVAAKHHIDMIQLAVDADAIRGHDQVIIGGRAFLFGAVLGIGHDEKFLHQAAFAVVGGILIGN